MHPHDRESSQGATVIRLAQPKLGQASGIPARAPRLLDQVRELLRARHHSVRTERACVGWIRRFIRFHGNRHPDTMAEPEIGAYLSKMAESKVSASTQNQALAALLLLYQQVLGRQLEWLGNMVHAKRPTCVPVVLRRDEVRSLLAHLDGVPWLVCALLYGGGLRLPEAVQLRVKDIDLERREVIVRRGKGQKDRRTVLPGLLVERLRLHLGEVKARHLADLATGAGSVALPEALARKYPNASREWIWQWLFPATRTYVDRDTREVRRHHLHESVVQRAVRQAAVAAQLAKPATPHTFRHYAECPVMPSCPPSPAGIAGIPGSPTYPTRHNQRLCRKARSLSSGRKRAGRVAVGAVFASARSLNPPPRRRLRHSHHPGSARSQGRAHDDDRHPRAEPRRSGRAEPLRHVEGASMASGGGRSLADSLAA
jgi:integron integrase